MIERLARRAGGFASTTALRWFGAVRDSAPEVNLPLTTPPAPSRKSSTPLTKSAVAGALVLASSNKVVRAGVAKGLLKLTESLRPESSNGSSHGAKRSAAPSNGTRANGGNGSHSLSEKTRADLYDMAKKKDITGRSKMSKEQLVHALQSH